MSTATGHKPRPVRTPRPNVPRLKPLKGSKANPTTVANVGATSSSTAACPNTSCTNPKIESYNGQQVCVSCGTVVSETNIVSEVQFGESNGGAAVVEGVFLGPNESRARSSIPGGNRIGLNTDSREKSDAEGRRKIGEIGAALTIHQPTQQAAFNIWRLCTATNFIQGRRINQVAAVCLYIACRKMEQENKWMLIDFSDLIHVNVFKLGHVYTTMLQALGPIGGVPSVIIENLVYRFVEKLDFGEGKVKVASDAVRIVQRMKKDWMAVGRRPAGVVGASVIMAARMNNFRRSVREIVYVAKVADMTINKRLEEFKITASSKLTVDEFRVMELELEHDPPAFYEDRMQKKKRKRGVIANENDNAEGEGQATSRLASETPQPSQSTSRRDADGFFVPAHPRSQSTPIDPSLISPPTTQPTPEPVKSKPRRGRPPKKGKKQQPTPEIEPDDEALANEINALVAQADHAPSTQPTITPSPTVIPFDADSTHAASTAPPTLAPDPTLTSPLINDSRSSEHTTAFNRACAVASQLIAIHCPPSSIPDTPIIPPDELDSDPDVANCLLTDAEREIKERIWIAENEDYLRQKQAKALAKEIADKEGERRGIKRRKRVRKGRIGEDGEETSGAATPQEAATRMLQRRGFSTRINYDAVQRLLSKERSQSRRASGLETPSAEFVAGNRGVESEGLGRAIDQAVEDIVQAEEEAMADEADEEAVEMDLEENESQGYDSGMGEQEPEDEERDVF